MIGRLFPQNESRLDRGIRIVIGIELLTLVFVGPRTTLGYVGLLPLITGLIGSCPLYTVFGATTDRPQRAS